MLVSTLVRHVNGYGLSMPQTPHVEKHFTASETVGHGFRIATGNGRSQAAEMVLAPGETEGGPDNCHRGADQRLYVLTGTGVAAVGGKRYPLKAGTLLLIERGDAHEISDTGRGALR